MRMSPQRVARIDRTRTVVRGMWRPWERGRAARAPRRCRWHVHWIDSPAMVAGEAHALNDDVPPLAGPAGEPPQVSVILPCLNEAETMATCVGKARATLQRLGLRGEVVVIDNGSSDGSPEIAERCGARVVQESRRGYGSALMRGAEEARAPFIIMADADDSYDLTDLERFVDGLRAGNDVVMGSRIRGTIEPGAMPWHHRWIGNPILTGLLNVLFRTGVSDAHCGLRMVARSALPRLDLRTPGMEFASEMVINAKRA